jgi:hypothetical protein
LHWALLLRKQPQFAKVFTNKYLLGYYIVTDAGACIASCRFGDKIMIILSGLALAVSLGTWQQVALEYLEVNVQNRIVYVENRGGTAVTVTGQSGVDGPRNQWVRGASDPAVTWDGRFDPLSIGSVSQSWSFASISVPASYSFFCDSNWKHQTGFQTFGYFDPSDSGLRLRRDRDWWIPNGVASGLIPLTEVPGGTPGGNG